MRTTLFPPEIGSKSNHGKSRLTGPGHRADAMVARSVFDWAPSTNNQDPPCYSTCLNDAWEVAERIASIIGNEPVRDICPLNLRHVGSNEYVADFGKYWWSREETPAFAICCAALEAMQTINDRYDRE